MSHFLKFPLMCPQPRHCFDLGVAVLLQPFCQEIPSNDPCLREPVHALVGSAGDILIGCCNVKVIMFNDILQHVGEFNCMYSYLDMGVHRWKFLMSIVKNLAPGVEITLLMSNLMVSRLAVGVPASNG